jgi:hypothetical protein
MPAHPKSKVYSSTEAACGVWKGVQQAEARHENFMRDAKYCGCCTPVGYCVGGRVSIGS